MPHTLYNISTYKFHMANSVIISYRPKKILYSYHVVTLHLHKITRILNLNHSCTLFINLSSNKPSDPSMNGATVISTSKVNTDICWYCRWQKNQYHKAYRSVLFMHIQRFTNTGHSRLTLLMTYNWKRDNTEHLHNELKWFCEVRFLQISIKCNFTISSTRCWEFK